MAGMDVHQALMRAIIAQPDDDVPRLALADWLEENGRQEAGELIRAQIALARLPEEDERRPELLGREAWLLARHTKELGRPVRRLAQRWELRRGCVEGVKLPAEKFLRKVGELFDVAPLRHLHLTWIGDHLADLAACPQLAQIEELTLSSNSFSFFSHWGWLGNLLRSPHLQGLRSLQLLGGAVVNSDVDAIAALPKLVELRLWDCRGVNTSPPIPLAQPGSLHRLQRIGLSGWTGAVDWPTAVPWLDVLELRRSPLRPQDMVRWITTRNRYPLQRTLILEGVGPGLDLAGLFASGALDQLHTLTLRHCSLGPPDAEAIVSRGPPGLVHLDLGNNPLGSRGVEALASSPRLGHLTHLGLAAVTEPDLIYVLVGPLFTSQNLPRLAALDLCRNGVTPSDILALARSHLAQRLYRLDLSHNLLGPPGVQALLGADWPRLAWLDVRNNGLDDASRAALHERFGWSVHY
jgi:uncharacterized protein (TIGR02996 family)